MGDFYIFTYQGKHSDSEIKDPPDTKPGQIVRGGKYLGSNAIYNDCTDDDDTLDFFAISTLVTNDTFKRDVISIALQCKCFTL